ncbi:sugar-binding protein, partial [Planctomycetota bacterium]
VIPSPGTIPQLDGNIDEVWFFSAEHQINTSQVGTAPSSDEDCSGTWRALWDSEALYVLAEIKDESLTDDNGGGSNKWNDDSVEIYVDGDNSKDTSPGTDDHQYTFWWGNEVWEEPTAFHNGTPSLVGVDYAVTTTDDGYLLEVKLPWMSIMGKAPTPGQLIGFDVWINDDDDGGDRDSQVSWYSTDGNGWQDPSVWGVALLEASNKAANPSPADDAIYTDTWATLSWLAAPGAVSHDLYLGENYADVEAGTGDTFQTNQTDLFYVIGFPGFPYPDGLVPGTRYYWRVDEVSADGTVSTGDVWSFIVPPKTAYQPVPADDGKFVDPDAALSWTPGHGAKLHTVYIGDDFDTVSNATGGSQSGITTFDPDTLEREKTYYWRVDEYDGFVTHTGNVWSFKTAKAGGGLRADYYTGSDFGTFILTRTDPQIDFTWFDPDAPDPAVGDNDFSIRWTGEVEAGYTETYTFYPKTDDGVRLWIDGKQLVDSWETVDLYPIEHSGTIDLIAGNSYSIVMEYFEGGDNAIAELRWESPSTPKQIIPQAALALPIKASSPNPRNSATGVKHTPMLKWEAGDYAASHEVYFGTDEEAVKNATTASPEYKGTKALDDESYDPGKLAWATTYFWRIDEVNGVNPDSPWIGSIWSFTTGDFLVVDGFEDYDTTDNQIWFTWNDGLGAGTPGVDPYIPGNGTGAAVGDDTTGSYTEESIVHSGAQSMPYWYDNNKQGFANYSEAVKTLSAPRDWTEEGVTELSLWFRGYPAPTGSFVEGPAGTYTMTASGADIWAVDGVEADEFHFAYKMLTGVGSIVAKVESVENTNIWAKAGVMIRETLDPDSAHATMVVTPDSGVSFQRRPGTGQTSLDTTTGSITAPYWVKIERDLSGNFTASHSANGSTWTVLGTENIQMGSSVHIGLALTSHDVALTCQAVMTNVSFTGTVGPQWANQDIGILNNDAEPLYVAVSNSAGTTAVVVHDDANAAQISTWTEWIIPLQVFADQGIVLTNVDKIAIGLGTKGNMTVPGGSGKMFIDDVRLYQPREAAE